ncbi:MAG TPA: ROK family protein [Candidatus Corynebacterium gallistercoris]|uniref:ROK family protein n=1 Tax=Candidatus Corynebacterium gallistercoris TaxID=2838530 RepID=A0A9D1UQS8_9CORY|nr:ROK family protein [Candidatus Corynebacterium gallistercoris]
MVEQLTVGVDIGGTNLRAAVVDAHGRIVDVEKLPTPSNVYALEKALAHAVGALQGRNEGIAGVGLAVAGFINQRMDTVRFAPHLPWRNAEITTRLSQRLGLPVILEHDANSAAWGEYFNGAARDAGTWVLFALGTGIGAALMVDGEIYRGAYGTAPEFGHLTVMPGGRVCPCGKRGCLERYCSGSALALTAQDLIATGSHPESRLAREFSAHPEEITGRSVVRMAREGDPLARDVVRDMGNWLGRALSLVQDVMDPELIVIGGGLSADADLFIDRAENMLHANIVGAGHRPVARVATAQLGGDAGMIGVALLARKKFI